MGGSSSAAGSSAAGASSSAATSNAGSSSQAGSSGPASGGSSEMGSSSSAGVGQLVVDTTALQFGTTPCGTAAPLQNLELTNSGTAALTVTASLGAGANSPYALGMTSISVAAGATAMLAVSPLAVPIPTALPASLDDVLTLTSDVPGDTARTVSLRQGAQGGVLNTNVTALPFGLVTAGSTATSTVEVRNTGTAAVTVNATIPGSSVFSVTPASAPVAPGQAALFTVAFSPTDATSSTAQLLFAAASGGALCQPAPAPLALTGTGRTGGLRFDPPAVDFGAVSCGTQASPIRFTMENVGNVPLSWTAVLNNTQDNRYTLARVDMGPLNGNLAAAGTLEFEVTTTGIPAVSDVADNLYGASITFFTDAAVNSTFELAIRQTAGGYILAFEPADLDMGSVPTSESLGSSLRLVNLGNAPATATVTSSNTLFALSGPDMMVPAATTDAVEVTDGVDVGVLFTPGMNTDAQVAELSVAVSAGVACQPLPPPAVVRAQGTNGSVVLQPTSLNFGNVPCGTQAAAADLVVSNPGNAPYTVTAELTEGADAHAFTLTPPDGVVMPGGSVIITVTPAAIPATSATPGTYGGILRISTDVDGDTPRDVPLRQNAYGAILGAPTTTTLAFATTPVNRTSTVTFSVPNTGNAPAPLTFANNNAVFSFTGTQALQGSGASVSALFAPTTVTTYADTATMGVAGGTPLCGPLPANRTFTLTGTATAMEPALTASTTLVDYGAVNCGVTSPQRTITLRNNGTAAATINGALLGGGNLDNSRFQVTLSSMSLAASGGTATVTVTPKAIAVGADTQVGEAAWSDTLRITADVGGTPEVLDIQLRQVATGGILSFGATALSIPNNQSRSVTLRNTGNASVEVNAASAGMYASRFTVQSGGSGSLGGNAERNITVAYARTLGDLTTNRAAELAPALVNGVLCRPLPANVTLTGTN